MASEIFHSGWLFLIFTQVLPFSLYSNTLSYNVFRHENKSFGGKFISNKINIINVLMKEHGFSFWLCAFLRTTFEVMTVGLFVVFE